MPTTEPLIAELFLPGCWNGYGQYCTGGPASLVGGYSRSSLRLMGRSEDEVRQLAIHELIDSCEVLTGHDQEHRKSLAPGTDEEELAATDAVDERERN